MSTRLAEMLQAECPDYVSVAKAPSFSDLTNHIEDEKTIAKIMQNESKKRYSSIDTDGKNIYLVQNPACMTYQVWLGCKVNIRPAPTLWRKAGGYRQMNERRLLTD